MPPRSVRSRQAADRIRPSRSRTARLPEIAPPKTANTWAIAAISSSVAASATIISTRVIAGRLIR